MITFTVTSRNSLGPTSTICRTVRAVDSFVARLRDKERPDIMVASGEEESQPYDTWRATRDEPLMAVRPVGSN